MIPFDDKEFQASVGPVLRPWLNTHVTGGQFSSFDGSRIQFYRMVNPAAKAVIVMLHGFCEFFGKFHETAYDFWESGYTVYFLEQRGHGASERFGENPDVVDVSDFSEYVEDLKCLLDQIVVPETQNFRTRTAVNGAYSGGIGTMGGSISGKMKLFLYAHSMGGCVGTLFLEKYPQYFYAAVLSSPMLKMNFGNTPMWQIKMLMAVSKLPGMSDKTMPGMKLFNPDEPDFEGSGSVSRVRFDYQFELRKDPASGGLYTMNAGTYRWGRAAMKATKEVVKYMDSIKIPLLVCQAGNDAYVDNEGSDELARKAKHVKLVRFPDAKHEIYASDAGTLEQYYGEILDFYRKAVIHRKEEF